MIIVKTIVATILLSVSMTVFNVNAEQAKYIVFEALPLNIKLADDGTGIVKNIKCKGCDFNIVKITENTKATKRGVEVNILEARKRAGDSAMVSFDPKTQEVLYIRWY